MSNWYRPRSTVMTCGHCGLPLRVWQQTWVHESGDRFCFSTAAEPEMAYVPADEVPHLHRLLGEALRPEHAYPAATRLVGEAFLGRLSQMLSGGAVL